MRLRLERSLPNHHHWLMGEQQSFWRWSLPSAVCALTFFVATAAIAQTPGKKDYDAALASATNTIPYAKQFLTLFPNSSTNVIVDEVGFSYYTGVVGPRRFRMHAWLFQRYDLQMLLSVRLDETGRKVIGFEKPEFNIRELANLSTNTKTGVDPSGARVSSTQWSIRYKGNQHHFGAKEWKKIVAANGDFSAIGYTIKTNVPVTRFQEFMDRNKGQ
jgi:hypothetical protein